MVAHVFDFSGQERKTGGSLRSSLVYVKVPSWPWEYSETMSERNREAGGGMKEGGVAMGWRNKSMDKCILGRCED